MYAYVYIHKYSYTHIHTHTHTHIGGEKCLVEKRHAVSRGAARQRHQRVTCYSHPCHHSSARAGFTSSSWHTHTSDVVHVYLRYVY